MLDEGERVGAMMPLTSVAHQLCSVTSAAVITTLERLAGLRA
jgi:hypothetical protein